jgi:hypothetical protein
MCSTRQTVGNVSIGYLIMAVFLSAGLTACGNSTSSKSGTDDMSFPTPVPQETAQTFRFGDPVESESHALIAAQSGLRMSFKYIEPFTVVKVKQMSYGEYSKYLGTSSNRPADLQVWLIIYFDDEWQAIAPVPSVTAAPPFHGCVSVTINAADGSPLEVGGPLQPGKISECDQ